MASQMFILLIVAVAILALGSKKIQATLIFVGSIALVIAIAPHFKGISNSEVEVQEANTPQKVDTGERFTSPFGTQKEKDIPNYKKYDDELLFEEEKEYRERNTVPEPETRKKVNLNVSPKDTEGHTN